MVVLVWGCYDDVAMMLCDRMRGSGRSEAVRSSYFISKTDLLPRRRIAVDEKR